MSVPMLLSFAFGILADRYSRFVLMFVGYGVAALLFVVCGVTTSFTLYLVLSVILGLAFAVASPAKQGFLVQVSPPQWIGTVQGLDGTFGQLGGLFGTLLVPLMYGAISGYVIAVCGAIALAGFVLAAPILGRESARLARLRSAENGPAVGG
jgi:MFS family permease